MCTWSPGSFWEPLTGFQPHPEHVHNCTLTISLRLLLSQGPPSRTEALPLASKVNLGINFLLAPHGPSSCILAPTCIHRLPGSLHLPCHHSVPLPSPPSGQLKQLPVFPTGLPPAHPPPHGHTGLCKMQTHTENHLSHSPQAPRGGLRHAFQPPLAPHSLPSLHPNPTGLLLWVYLSHYSFQLPGHTQSCFHDLKSSSCPFSHRISAKTSLLEGVFFDPPYWVSPPTHTPRTVLGSHGHGCHLQSSVWFPDPCPSPLLRRS